MFVATVATVSSRVFPQLPYAAVNHSFSRFVGGTYIVTFKYATHPPPWAPGSTCGRPTLPSPGVWQAHIVEDWQALLSAGYLKTLPAFPSHHSCSSSLCVQVSRFPQSRDPGQPRHGCFCTVRELNTLEGDATTHVLLIILLMNVLKRSCSSSSHDLDSNQKQLAVGTKVLFQLHKLHLQTNLHNCFSKKLFRCQD